MEPITAAAGGLVSIAGGIAQYLNSKEASAADQGDINNLKDLLSRIQQPNFDMSSLKPKDYQIAAQYVPQVAPYIAEAAPQTVKAQGAGATAGNAAQMAALQKLIQQSQTGSDVQQEVANQKAQQAAAAGAQSNRASLDESFQRRGQLGGGMQYAANLAGISDLQNQQGQADQNAAVDAANRRMQALNQSAGLGGDLYNQDVGLEKYNVGLINDFNQRQTASQNAYGRYGTGILNDANQQNTGRSQKVSDMNTQGANDAQKFNIQYPNTLKQEQYNNLISKYNLNSGITGMQINQRDNATNQTNQAIAGVTGGVSGGLNTYMNQQGAQDRFNKTFDQNERRNKAAWGDDYQ